MKRIIFSLTLFLMICLDAFSQATSMTIDCQNPGWLSSKINYGDQLTLCNLTVTGYIDQSDLAFIGSLMKKSLNGHIDLSNVDIVGSYANTFKENTFNINSKINIEYLSLPKSLKTINDYWSYQFSNELGWNYLILDTLIIGGEAMPELGSYPLSAYDGRNGDYINPSVIIVRNGVKKLVSNLQSEWDYPSVETLSYRFRNLKRMELPESLTSIGDIFFADAQKLQYLNLPDAIDTIGCYAFLNTSFLPDVLYMPKNLNTLSFSIIYGTLPSVLFLSDKIESIRNIRLINNSTVVPILDGETMEIHIKSSKIPEFSVASGWNGGIYDSCLRNCTLYVPDTLIQKYKSNKYYKYATILAEKEIEELQMDNVSTHYYVGDQIQLSANYYPLDATDKKIFWKISSDTIASLTQDGFLDCLKYGEAIITASTSYNRLSKELDIKVFEHTAGVELDTTNISLLVNESYHLVANVLPLNYSDGEVEWTSTNNNVAEVDSQGNVKAIKGGHCEIICTTKDRSYQKRCAVNVIQPVMGVELNKNSITLNEIGETVDLVASIIPEDATNNGLNWSSSNEKVCKVISGTVIALRKGRSTIKVTTIDGGFTDTCNVYVGVDVNGDGKVNVSDITELVNMILGITPMNQANADVDENGKVNVSDVATLINIILGIE